MLPLAKTVFTNLMSGYVNKYQVMVNKPFLFMAQIFDDRDELIKKIEMEVTTDGYYSFDDVYVINKNGVMIQLHKDGKLDIRLIGESMADFMDIFVKSMLVENTSFTRLPSTSEYANYLIKGDIVLFIDGLSKSGFDVVSKEDSEYCFIHTVKTNMFNMVIDDQNDILDVKIYY